jgi:hypothetical protein
MIGSDVNLIHRLTKNHSDRGHRLAGLRHVHRAEPAAWVCALKPPTSGWRRTSTWAT